MRIDILTLFPEFFDSPLNQSMLRRAQALGKVSFQVLNLRDYAYDRHKVADDRPFGGGPGMVMKPEPVVEAIRQVRAEDEDTEVVFLSPSGRLFDQGTAAELAQLTRVLLICGHYEGVDERVRHFIDREISIGDYVLTGGEIPALVVVDAVTRLVPGVLGNDAATEEESFQTGLLEYPHYTRPRDFEGLTAPEVLLSGDHARIARWRRQQSLRRTKALRPDLLAKATLSSEDKEFLATLSEESGKDR
jgi:tRNA (guanine37-N1)-methyltransferase